MAGYTSRYNPLFLAEIQEVDVRVQLCFFDCFTQVTVVRAILPPLSVFLYVITVLGNSNRFWYTETFSKYVKQ